MYILCSSKIIKKKINIEGALSTVTFLSFQYEMSTFYQNVSPQSTDPVLLYSAYSRLQNVNRVFLDSQPGPTLTCLVTRTKKLQKPFVYILQLAVHTVQINWICRQGIPYAFYWRYTIDCQMPMLFVFGFFFLFFFLSKVQQHLQTILLYLTLQRRLQRLNS